MEVLEEETSSSFHSDTYLYHSDDEAGEDKSISTRQSMNLIEQGVTSPIKYDSWDTLCKTMFKLVNPSPSNFGPLAMLECLEFCYLFPKNYEFYRKHIIYLWMAQGFLQPSPFETMEDTGQLCFDAFQRHHIFQLSSSAGTGAAQLTSRYKLNHSIVDLLQDRRRQHSSSSSSQIYCRLDDMNSYICENTLHASIGFSLKELDQAHELRTLLILPQPQQHGSSSHLNQIPRHLFLKLPLLRALDMSHTNITELPTSIGNLKDLRYLNLSSTPITLLPNSLCSLYQMQTLELRGCFKLVGLPEGINKLTKLRHLDVDVECLLVSMPPGLKSLVKLQTLPAFVVGKEVGCHITELKNMVNIRGAISILRLENVISCEQAKEAALNQKKYLHELSLHWTELQNGLGILENLQPHTLLGELQIAGYGGVKFPSWIGDPSFSVLTNVTIHDCRKCELLPSLGNLPSLKCLCISDMHAVKEIDHQICCRNVDFKFNTFPMLESLTINEMPKLEKWSGIQEGDFLCLKKFTLSSCPKLKALPKLSVLNSLEKLDVSLCPLVKYFPNEGLPTSLQYLILTDCPLLKDRCQKDEGREWGKIMDIPNVWIDYQQISQAQRSPTTGTMLLPSQNQKPSTTILPTSHVDESNDASVDSSFMFNQNPTLNQAQPSPTTGLVPLPQRLKSVTVPGLSTSIVDNSKDASNDLMFKPHGDPKENSNDDQEKNNKDTTAPSKPKSFLSNLILNPFKSFTLKDAQVDHRSSSNIASIPGTSKYISSGSALSSSGTGNSLVVVDVLNPIGEILPTPDLRIFSFTELKNATRNFKSDCVLGEGGFGKVFKGWIDEKYPAMSGSGHVVAIKMLNSESMLGFEEWQAEVNFLGRLSHPNLVRLLGYCWEDNTLLLVYEFMQKGSLENHLFRRGSAVQPISWKLRLKILLDAARGLAFLHSSEKKIIYRDFKSSNILLDANYNAKLSDFELEKKGPMGGASHVTTRVMGTYGYAAPEYVATGHLHVKSVVFGFGVVLLEMLTGQRAIDTNRPSGQLNLVDWLKPSLSDRRKLMRILDPRLEGDYPSKGVIQAAKLTLKCLGSEPRVKPSMKEVVESLEQIQSIKSKSKT